MSHVLQALQSKHLAHLVMQLQDSSILHTLVACQATMENAAGLAHPRCLKVHQPIHVV